MRAPGGKVPEEQWLLERANRQLGLLRDEDLAGRLGRNAIQHRCRTCRLTRLRPGVYAFGHTALRQEAHWLAALWTCGEATVLSHFTAAAYHGWPVPAADDRIHLATTGREHSRDGIAIHRTRHLDPIDVLTAKPFRVTRVPRTLVDLADVLTWSAFRALADGQRRLDIPAIRAAQQRTTLNRAGAPLVTRLIEADDAHTKSEFERRYLRFCRDHGVPLPDHLNHAVAGHTADCVYDGARLVVELDGRAFHRRRAQMRADRRRDSDYQVAGFWILRLVWDDLHPDEASATAARVRRMLRI